MNEREEMLNVESVKVKKPNRKEAKQISFRVSEDEFLKLKHNAEILEMSVPKFVKMKAQGTKYLKPVEPKIAKEDSREMVRQLSKIGTNLNQLAAWCNSDGRVPLEREENFIAKFEELRKEVNEVWQRLN